MTGNGQGNPKVRFVFGCECTRNLEEIAANLPESAWSRLERPARYQVKTQPRRRPSPLKEQIVKGRQFENKRLDSEDVAEFLYQPTACRDPYRMVVVRKNISVVKGEQVLFPLNDWNQEPPEFESVPVIPVLIPGALNEPELPMFLGNRTRIDLRNGVTPELLEKIVWGITGKKPSAKRTRRKSPLPRFERPNTYDWASKAAGRLI